MNVEGAEVLLVDDPATVEQTATVLGDELPAVGIRTAADIEAALAVLDETRIDCVVSNFEIPDGNGVEFFGGLKLLRRVRDGESDLPFILFTSIGNEDIAREAIEADVTDYLLRWGGEEAYGRLADRIRTAIARRRAERAAERQARINEVIRDVNQALVRADTREEIEQTVCARLVEGSGDEATGYSLAWLGTVDGGHLETTAVTGADAEEINGVDADTVVTSAVDGESSLGYETGDGDVWTVNETQVIASVAVKYGETGYGALVVGTDRAAGFTDTERDVLPELGDTIADAIDAAESRTELERQNDRLEEFASVISHDLRNPLSVARGYLGEFRETGAESAIDEVETSLSRIDTLIEDVLALARQGQAVVEPSTVEAATVARRSWNNVATDDATLRVDDPGTVEADPSRLQRLFENLFRNGVEHGSTSSRSTTDGTVEHGSTGNRTSSDDDAEHGSGVTVTVGAVEGPRDADGTNSETNESKPSGFYVADDGPGIPPEERERVLEAGYTTADDGTGFGLAIVNEVASAHGWDAAITESEAGGTRIEFRT